MGNAPARFTVADISRAMLAANKAPYPAIIEIAPDSTIRIVPVDKSVDSKERPELKVEEGTPVEL